MMGGLNMQMLARSFLAWELTHSAIAVVAVGAGFAPPILLLSLFGGALADRVDRKRVIQYGQLAATAIALFVAVSVLTDTITIMHLIGASVVQGMMFAFLMPARQAIIPQLVPKEQMTNAIALSASGMSIMTMAAPGIGGLIYAYGGPEATYFAIAGMNIGALLLTSFLPNETGRGIGKSGHMWRDVKEGVGYVSANRTVMMLLVVALFTTLLAMPFRSLMPVQIETVFDRDVESLGLLMSMIGVGSLVGSLFIAGLSSSERRGLVLLATTMLSGFAITLSAINTSYTVAILIMMVLGLGDSGRRALNASLIMEQVDEEHRGRVMGVYMMNFGLIPIGAIPLGVISQFADVRLAFGLAGGLLIAAAAVATLGTRRIREL